MTRMTAAPSTTWAAVTKRPAEMAKPVPVDPPSQVVTSSRITPSRTRTWASFRVAGSVGDGEVEASRVCRVEWVGAEVVGADVVDGADEGGGIGAGADEGG